MKTLILGIKKEWMEALRTKKVIGLVALALFFGIMDPVMLRLTPYLLKEFSGMDLEGLIQLSQIAEIKDFHNDIFQLFTVISVIIISNTWIKEIKDETMVIPVSKGASISQILLAKSLVYSGLLIGLMVVTYSINYYYAGIIFGFRIDYYQAALSGLYMGFYFAFLVFFMVAVSTVITHFAGLIFITLVVAFAGPFLAGLFDITMLTPFGLAQEAGLFARVVNPQVLQTLLVTLLLMVGVYALGCLMAEKKEVYKYR